jgi:RNA polymerase sigma-70 factor (ECF subfamily)
MERHVTETASNSLILSQVEALYTDHHGWLQGWLRGRLGNQHQAADLAQDTFLRLLVSRRLPQAEQGRGFLLQIARNLVIDQWRRQRIEQAYLHTLASVEEPVLITLEERAVIIETLVRIDRMLDTLASNVRAALLMSQFEGLNYQQISERLGVSLSSVQKYMTRAIQACYEVMYSE